MQPGSYRLTAVPLPHAMVVEVGAEGLVDARIEVPPPAKVVVRIFGESGDDEPTDSILWERPPLRMWGAWTNSVYTVFRNAESDAFEFLAPLGRIWIQLDSDAHVTRTKRVDVIPGVNEVEISSGRGCGITVKLKDGETILPFDDDYSVTLDALDGNGWSTGWRSSFGKRSYVLSAPGFYRVSVSDIEGYLPIPSREVRVEAGKLAECVFTLERRP